MSMSAHRSIGLSAWSKSLAVAGPFQFKWVFAGHGPCRLVVAQPAKRRMTQLSGRRPLEKRYFGNELRLQPVELAIGFGFRARTNGERLRPKDGRRSSNSRAWRGAKRGATCPT
jgi:hypothetical protein